MNILFLTLADLNSVDERGIYTDLMREFVAHGHEVFIVSPTERRSGQSTRLIEGERYRILKLRTGNVQKTNMIEKTISTLLLGMQFARAVRKYFSAVRFDLVLYSTPPITLCSAIAYVKRRDGAKTYLLLKDIFPQNAVDLGMLSKHGVKGLLYRYFRMLEKRLYSLSDYIGCMSPANVDYVLKHNPELDPDIVEVCPNSIDPLPVVSNRDDRVATRQRYGLPLDRTVFIYGGNLGKPQGIDFLIECLKANRDNQQVFFVIVGSGTEFERLVEFVRVEKPDNAILLSQLPRADYEALVGACDVGLIFLDRRFTIPNFPSRLLSYMQASMPVLAATDTSTDLRKIIEDGRFGVWCRSGDIEEFSRKLRQLCDPGVRDLMGRNARKYLEDHYTVKRSYEIIMKHFL